MLCGNETLPIEYLFTFIEWMRNVDFKFGCPHVDEKVFPISLCPQWLSILGIGRLEKHVINRKKQHDRSSLREERPQGVAEIFPVGLIASDPGMSFSESWVPFPFQWSLTTTSLLKTSMSNSPPTLSSQATCRQYLANGVARNTGGGKRLGITTDLPSWVPNFNLYGFRELNKQRPFVHADSIDADAEVWSPRDTEALKPETYGKNLRVSGVVCEPIVEEPEVFYYETALSSIQRFLPGESDDSVKYYPTGIPIHQALVRILLKDPGILREDDESHKIDVDMMLGAAIAVYESMLAPEHSTEELFAFWRTIGFKYEIPTHEELQIMLFGDRLNDAEGVIHYIKDKERDIANRKTVMFQMANWDQEYMFRTANGYIGLSDGEAKSADQVGVIFGCRQTVILRPVGVYYQFIGVCYVLGLMEGEAVQDVKDGKHRVEAFDIQ
jgi:hypothetical protein